MEEKGKEEEKMVEYWDKEKEEEEDCRKGARKTDLAW